MDDWNLMDFHTVLHLLTSYTDDQIALLQLFAVATPAEDAADIWDSWAAAFSGPTDPPLPIGFNQSALNTLQSPFTDPEALTTLLNDLATWDGTASHTKSS